MEKIIQQGILYDFYGELLTDHQKQIYEALVYENLSAAEIAGEQGISRQAVHDLIKRTDKILEDYEEKLGLVKRFMVIRDQIGSIDKKLSDCIEEHPDRDEELTVIRNLCKQILDIM